MSELNGLIKRLRDIMRQDPGISGDAQRIEQISWLLFLKVYDFKEGNWLSNPDEDYESIIPERFRWRSWASPDNETGKSITGDKLLDFVNNELFPTLKSLNVDSDIRKSIVKSVFEEMNQYMKDGVLLRQVISLIDAITLDDYTESKAFG